MIFHTPEAVRPTKVIQKDFMGYLVSLTDFLHTKVRCKLVSISSISFFLQIEKKDEE